MCGGRVRGHGGEGSKETTPHKSCLNYTYENATDTYAPSTAAWRFKAGKGWGEEGKIWMNVMCQQSSKARLRRRKQRAAGRQSSGGVVKEARVPLCQLIITEGETVNASLFPRVDEKACHRRPFILKYILIRLCVWIYCGGGWRHGGLNSLSRSLSPNRRESLPQTSFHS